MSTMAEVIAAHQRKDKVDGCCGPRTIGCACGIILGDVHGSTVTPSTGIGGRWHAEHVAEELAKAGYGKLADAFDQGQKSGMRHADRVIAADRLGRPELPGPPSPNPYRGMP